MYGIKLIDYQAYGFMKSWWTPFVLWLCSRRTGKTVTASVFLQAKMLLIPNYNVYISTNSAAQSVEIFKMIENIALQRVPSFATATDIFAMEVEKNSNNKTGFVHDTAGHRFRLPNNSQLLTLSTHAEANRGKGGSVFLMKQRGRPKNRWLPLNTSPIWIVHLRQALAKLIIIIQNKYHYNYSTHHPLVT